MTFEICRKTLLTATQVEGFGTKEQIENKLNAIDDGKDPVDPAISYTIGDEPKDKRSCPHISEAQTISKMITHRLERPM